MKKLFLTALMALPTTASFATAAECFQVQNAIEFTLANGAGWNSTQLSDVKAVLSPEFKIGNYFTKGSATTLAAANFLAPRLAFSNLGGFDSNMSWSGEFSIAGKFALGSNMFARLSAFIGCNLGFAKANVPVTVTETTVGVSTAATAIAGWDSVQYGTDPKQVVTMKSGLGYGIMASLGKETHFGSMSVDLGVVFRTFSFYFPSATAIQSTASGTAKNEIIPIVGYTLASNSVDSSNAYGSYYNRYTQAGFRFGGSLSFKLIENLSFGISAAAEIFGNKSFTINPNISSFTSTMPVAAAAATSTTAATADAPASQSSQKASSINNQNMMSSAVSAMAKNVVTNVMMTLTYSVPMGN